MAQEPSGTGGQQPPEYDYGQSWQQDQAPAADSWSTGADAAAGDIPGGHDHTRTHGADQDAQWSEAVQQQDPYAAQQQYAEPGYGQDPYYGSYGTEAYGQGYAGQGYAGQDYAAPGYGYGTTEQNPPDPYAGPPAVYRGEPQGQQDGSAEPHDGAQPYYPEGTQPYEGTQSYYPEGAQPYEDAEPYGSGQPQNAATGDDSTQQWQASAPGAQAQDPAPGSEASQEPGGSTGDTPGNPRAVLVARIRSAVTGGSGGPGRRGLLIRAAVGVVVLAVVAVVGIQLVGGGSDGSPAPSSSVDHPSAAFAIDHTKAWSAPTVASAGADGSTPADSLLGSWLLAKAVVRGDGTGVRAYDLTSGNLLWTLKPPKPGAVPCGMSPTANGTGIGAVLFAAKAGSKTCTMLSAVDTATGKQKWTATLSGTHAAYAAHVMVNDTRVVAVGDSTAVGYDSVTGKQKWDSTGRGKFCTLVGAGSGSSVLLYSSCADSKPKDQMVTLDASSGRLIWWRSLNNPTTVSILSAEPAVVLTTGEKETDDTIHYWDDKGNAGPEIPVTQPGGRLDVDQGVLDPSPTVFFSGTTMATTLENADGSTPANASLTAVNLASGKPVWKVAAQEKGNVQPVGIDGGALVAATEERADEPAHLSRFTLTDGAEAAGGGFPRNTGSLLTSGRLLTSDTLVVAVPTFTSNYKTAATGFKVEG